MTETHGPAEWRTLPDVAEQLDVPVNKVHQLIREKALIAVRRDPTASSGWEVSFPDSQ